MTAKHVRIPLGRLALVALVMIGLSGCAGNYSAPVKPPTGLLFTTFKAPLTTDFNGNPCGTATKKVSMSRTNYFYDFILTGLDFGWGEAEIARMARERGITEVSYADYEILYILGVFARFTVHIYGN